MKRLKGKYDDQSDEEKELVAKLLGARGGADDGDAHVVPAAPAALAPKAGAAGARPGTAGARPGTAGAGAKGGIGGGKRSVGGNGAAPVEDGTLCDFCLESRDVCAIISRVRSRVGFLFFFALLPCDFS